MLSVIIITKNEAANIERCLLSVKFADEIIVVDSGSEDDTVAIAKKYTDKVTVRTDWCGYGVQKQRALEQATGDWVLNLDADESLSPQLQAKIQTVMQTGSYEAYRIPIQMFFYDKPLKYSLSPKRHIRLFRNNGASYSTDIVHEKIILPDHFRVAKIKSAILHSSFQDVSHAIYKMNRYSSYSAKIKLSEKKPRSFSKTILASLWMFFRSYILQKGFLDGKMGFVCAILNTQGTFYRGIKQIYPDKEWQVVPSPNQEEIANDSRHQSGW